MDFTRVENGSNGTVGAILGSYNTLADLKAAHPTGEKGDTYLVQGELYVWCLDNNDWQSVGNIQGPAGYTPIKGVDYVDGVNGQDGKDGVDGIGVKSIAIENNHLMVTLSNDEVIDAGEMPAGAGGESGVDSEEVVQLKSEIAYLQSEIDHMMMQIADDTCGAVYEWVYHFYVPTGDYAINVAHVTELWADVDAMGIDPFLDAIYEEDAYRLYILRCAADLKYMNRYEVLPVADNPMQQIGHIADWDPVKDITSWTFEGDQGDPNIYLDGAPTSDMIFALLKVKK